MALIDQSTIERLNNPASGGTPEATFSSIKKILFDALDGYILPTAFFLIIAYGIWGAVQYFTAYGSDEKATKGKKTMTWAIVGAIVVASAFLIIRYINKVVGAEGVSSNLD